MQQKGLNSKWNGKQYDESTIESHDGLEMVRVRPEVFIGRRGPEGVYKMFLEGVANVLDEFNAGRCENMWINVDTKNNIWSVTDDAFGIPIGKFHEVCTKLSTGGKFGKSSYTFSVGLNAMGMKLLNALSTHFIADTYFGGKHGHLESYKGVEDTKAFYIKDDTTHHTGTYIQWSPDIEIFEDLSADVNRYMNYIEVNSYINAGIKVHFVWDGKLTEFYHPEGMAEYFKTKIIKAKKLRIVAEPKAIQNKTSIPNPANASKPINMAYDMYITWAENAHSEYVESYVNGLKTVNHGSHVTGVHMAVTKAIKDYINKNDLLPKNAKYDITGDDVRESMVLLINANHSDPHYTTQVKDSIDNNNLQTFVNTSVYPILQSWLGNNKKEADNICKLVIRSAKARQAAKDAKENIIKASSGKISLIDINPKKFAGCKSKNPDECEVFIVEGDSAFGSCKLGRNTDYQSIFAVRGKGQNVIGPQTIKLSDEHQMLVEILGCGINETFDINKLRYHKIILASDADADGYNIKSLLTGFFFRFYKPIIEAGYLYEAMPPLFQINVGKGKNKTPIYLQDQKVFDNVVAYTASEAFDMEDIRTGKKLSKDLIKIYTNKLKGYKSFIESISRHTGLESELLEFIVRYYRDICKCDFKAMSALDYECSVVSISQDHLHLTIDRGYEHYFCVINNNFYNTVYLPIAKRLSEIKLMDIRFVGKHSGEKYGGSCYRNAKFIDGLLINDSAEISRIKGLGESNPLDLRTYLLNPNTRILRRITMSDVEKAAKTLDMCLGNDIENRKKFCMNGVSVY